MRTKNGMIKGIPAVKNSIDTIFSQYRKALKSHEGEDAFTFKVPATSAGIKVLHALKHNHTVGGGKAEIDYVNMSIVITRGVSSETSIDVDTSMSGEIPAAELAKIEAQLANVETVAEAVAA